MGQSLGFSRPALQDLPKAVEVRHDALPRALVDDLAIRQEKDVVEQLVRLRATRTGQYVRVLLPAKNLFLLHTILLYIQQ